MIGLLVDLVYVNDGMMVRMVGGVGWVVFLMEMVFVLLWVTNCLEFLLVL